MMNFMEKFAVQSTHKTLVDDTEKP